ncbi:hypothetical protein DFJ74DRAFT_763949 [Hyaloraphidium curvatum]|nr:hypothetical protein DFJ74DRAFT_763949 [Hyaloraphidium curvatum]
MASARPFTALADKQLPALPLPESPPTSTAATALNSSPDQPQFGDGNDGFADGADALDGPHHELVKVFLSNISTKVSEAKLASVLEPLHAAKIELVRDVDPAYATLYFEDEFDATEAYRKLHGLLLSGLTMRASVPQNVLQNAKNASRVPQIAPGVASKIIDPDSNIYVKNLDAGVDEKVLYYLFTAFGEIVSVRIVRDASGAHRGYGFVCYSNPASAKQAVAAMNHRKVGPRKISCALSNRKEEERPRPPEPENWRREQTLGPWSFISSGVAQAVRMKEPKDDPFTSETPIRTSKGEKTGNPGVIGQGYARAAGTEPAKPKLGESRGPAIQAVPATGASTYQRGAAAPPLVREALLKVVANMEALKREQGRSVLGPKNA